MSDAAEKRQRCTAVRRDGLPCQALATHTGLCIAHSPESQMWRAKGGASTSRANRATRLLPARLEPLVSALEQVFSEVRAGERSEKNGLALARIATAIKDLTLSGEIEERTRQLEQLASEWRRDLERSAEPTAWWESRGDVS